MTGREGGGLVGNFLDYLFLAGHITPRYVLMFLYGLIKVIKVVLSYRTAMGSVIGFTMM